MVSLIINYIINLLYKYEINIELIIFKIAFNHTNYLKHTLKT